MSAKYTLATDDWLDILATVWRPLVVALVGAVVSWLADLPSLLEAAGLSGGVVVAVVLALVPVGVAGLKALQNWLTDEPDMLRDGPLPAASSLDSLCEQRIQQITDAIADGRLSGATGRALIRQLREARAEGNLRWLAMILRLIATLLPLLLSPVSPAPNENTQ